MALHPETRSVKLMVFEAKPLGEIGGLQ